MHNPFCLIPSMTTTFEFTVTRAIPMTKRYQRLLKKYGIVACSQCGYTGEVGIAEYVLEEHHLDGHHSGKTVLLCLNCHSEITHKQHCGIRYQDTFTQLS